MTIEDFEGCPRYIGRLFRDVRIGPSPPWLKARLTAAGMRPISNVVDVTNYVMLALGNPLHAFDFDTLGGGRIIVRRARPGEEFTSLDGNLRKLDPADLVIADAERAIAFAGIMGGLDTEVTRDDDLRAARGGELRAGHDPLELRAPRAAHRGLEPLGEGRRPVPRARRGPARDPAHRRARRRALDRRRRRQGRAAGAARRPLPHAAARTGSSALEIDEQEQKDILERLGFDVVPGWDVHVPTWRMRDVTREIDLVEEVARVHGLEKIPFTLPLRSAMSGRLSQDQRLRRLVEDVLVGAGLLRGLHAQPRRRGTPTPTRCACPSR